MRWNDIKKIIRKEVLKEATTVNAGNTKFNLRTGVNKNPTKLGLKIQFEPLAGGLEIRFAGDDMDPDSGSTANASGTADECEIEVFGKYEDVDNSSGKAVKMTRIRKYGRLY